LLLKWPYIMDLPIKNGDFHDWNRRLKNHRCKSSKDMIHDVKIFEETTKATTLCPIIFGNRSKKYGGGIQQNPWQHGNFLAIHGSLAAVLMKSVESEHIWPSQFRQKVSWWTMLKSV
jgi:hypothetical protein